MDEQQKQELVATCLKETAKMFYFTMQVIGKDNFIEGTLELEGSYYQVSCRKVESPESKLADL